VAVADTASMAGAPRQIDNQFGGLCQPVAGVGCAEARALVRAELAGTPQAAGIPAEGDDLARAEELCELDGDRPHGSARAQDEHSGTVDSK
jgi:hypothetical protein